MVTMKATGVLTDYGVHDGGISFKEEGEPLRNTSFDTLMGPGLGRRVRITVSENRVTIRAIGDE